MPQQQLVSAWATVGVVELAAVKEIVAHSSDEVQHLIH